MNVMDNNGIKRQLNYKQALHRYGAERYFQPEKGVLIPNDFEIDISKIGVFDQLDFGSCTFNAWANLIDVRQMQNPNASICFYPTFMPASRMFGYRKETELDGNPGIDNGSYLHTGAAVVSTFGAVAEKDYPYNEIDLENPIPDNIMQMAALHKLPNAAPVQLDINTILATLASGNPIVFGMPIYQEFMNLNSTNFILNKPTILELSFGGHANMLYGFEKINGIWYFKGLNSWGAKFGNNGTYLAPEDFVLQFFSDLWTAW